MHIYESIVYPTAQVTEDFHDAIMPRNFKEQLSPQQLADLIAFLMTK
jgi:hypothetical protein